MRPRRPALALVVLLLLAPPFAVPAAEDDPEAALRDEDVVRMLVSGAAEDDVVARIRSSAVAFDLSDEMVEELRIAGVSERVLGVMRERQAEVDRESVPSEPGTVADDATTRIVVRIGVQKPPRGGGPVRLEFPGLAPPALAAALELDSEIETWAVGGAALYLACLTADHVPNQWRRESPLGRDFASMPRHRMLAFHPVVDRVPASKKTRKVVEGISDVEVFERIDLEVPDRLEALVDPGVVHDLSLGIAVEIGGRYYRYRSVETDTPVAEDGALILRAEITGRLDNGFAAELRWSSTADAGADD